MELVHIAISFIKSNWYKYSAAAVLNALILLVGSWVLYNNDVEHIIGITTEKVNDHISRSEFSCMAIAMVVSTILWYFNRSIPTNEKNKIGIIIAITTENEQDKIRVRNDFIKSIQDKINAGSRQAIFNLIVYPEYYTSQLTMQNYLYFLKKSRAHYIIFGETKRRSKNNEEHYAFKLNAGIRHAPIPTDISKQFASDMSEVLPTSVNIPVKDELDGFEIMSEWAAIGSEYVIGVAAAYSGDIVCATDMHMKVYNELNKIKSSLPALKALRDKNKVKLIDCLFQQQIALYNNYKRTGKHELLDPLKNVLDKMKIIEPNHYGSKLSRAIVIFIESRDVDKALNEIRKPSTKPDDTWRYSEAFLLAYSGQLDKAIQAYRKASKGYVPRHVPNDVELFMKDVIEKEPEKYQLWFCVGFVNYFVKDDKALAKEDFTEFLARGNDEEYKEARRLAREYIRQMEHGGNK